MGDSTAIVPLAAVEDERSPVAGDALLVSDVVSLIEGAARASGRRRDRCRHADPRSRAGAGGEPVQSIATPGPGADVSSLPENDFLDQLADAIDAWRTAGRPGSAEGRWHSERIRRALKRFTSDPLL